MFLHSIVDAISQPKEGFVIVSCYQCSILVVYDTCYRILAYM